MAVERIDAQVQSLISGVARDSQKEANEIEESDAARRRAVKKIEEKKKTLKETNVHKESFQRTTKLQSKMRQVLGGTEGQAAAQAAQSWGDNKKLQAKLSEAHKNQFREAMVNNPGKATRTAGALNRLTKSPEFSSVNTDRQAASIQGALIENPELEGPASELLQSRFMKSPRSDSATKNRFMDFGLRQAKKGGTDFKLGSVKHTGDMLGAMVKGGTTKGAQRSAMKMAEARPGDFGAMKNVDAFVSNPAVKQMPSFARGKATQLLADAGGTKETTEAFTKLAKNPGFKSLSPKNQGRFFSTVGSGRAGEFEAISNKLNQSLQGEGFPERSNQVTKFLGTVSRQVAQGGAKGVKTDAALRGATTTGLPSPPVLLSTEGLSKEEALQVRAQNRANVIQFYNKLSRSYDAAEKKLNSAKYLEDVNSLQQLREPPELDTSSLSPEEMAFVVERRASVKERLASVKKLQRQRVRDLRGKRMPPSKRRALASKRRMRGKQPKYFSPNQGLSTEHKGAEGLAEPKSNQKAASRPTSTPATPPRGGKPAGRGGALGSSPGNIQDQVAAALSQLGSGPMTAAQAGLVAETIATQVAAQVAAQVSKQLMGAAHQGPPAPVEAAGGEKQQVGKRDGWGIPRSFEADLGGTRRPAVKPRTESGAEGLAPEALRTREEIVNERYTGRTLVKDPSLIRDMPALFQSTWKGLNRSEMALLKNLGWNQQLWDTRDTPSARWPIAMATSFVNLTPTQREAVRKLGFSSHEWDKRIQGARMGKNA